MNNVTKKWIFLKASSVILIPLMLWFIINLVSIYDKEYQQPTKLLFSLLLIFAFFFSNLSISEVFEDYIQDEKTKNAANQMLRIFAIIVPVITIIIIFKL